MAYEINYEKKQLDIIKKSIPILIQQIKNGNPFRPTFQGNQLSYRFFRKQVYNLWNIVTDEDLSIEYEDETIWADMFVDFLMEINNTNNIARKAEKQQPTEQDNKNNGIQKSEKDSETSNSGIQKPEKDDDTSKSGIQKREKDSDTPSSRIQKREKDSDTPNSRIQKPDKDSDTPNSRIQKPEKDSDTPNSTIQKSKQDEKSAEAENAVGQHNDGVDSNKEDSNINEMDLFITFATTNGFLKISDIDSELIENSLTPRDVNAEDAKTKIKKTKQSKKKWTLRRIFAIICPCLRPKDK